METDSVGQQSIPETDAIPTATRRHRIPRLVRWNRPRWWLLGVSVRTGLWLIPGGIALMLLARTFPNVTEVLYGHGAFRLLVLPLSSLTGVLPISVAELFGLCLAVCFLGTQGWRLWANVTGRRVRSHYPGTKPTGDRATTTRQRWLRRFAKFGAFVGVVWFAFLLTFGLNYCRPSLSELHGHASRLASAPPQPAELQGLAIILIRRANDQREIAFSSPGEFQLGEPIHCMSQAQLGFKELHHEFPSLTPTSAPPKLPVVHPVMSMLGIGGIYFPFTGEANVNRAAPDWTLPFVASHELAHQKGIAREDEANWLAFLACADNPEPEYRYSGTLMGLLYVLSALGQNQPGLPKAVLSGDSSGLGTEVPSLSDKVLADVDAYRIWTKRLSGPTQAAGRAINNLYLKANAQSDGIRSYGRMADLLVMDYRTGRIK